MSNLKKPVRELINKVAPIGWSFAGYNHAGKVVLVHTSGIKHTLAATPSDWRNEKNAIAELERLCGQRLPRAQRGRGRGGRTAPRSRVERPIQQRDEDARAREEARQQEQQRRWAAARAAADDRRRRQIEELMRP